MNWAIWRGDWHAPPRERPLFSFTRTVDELARAERGNERALMNLMYKFKVGAGEYKVLMHNPTIIATVWSVGDDSDRS